MSLPKRFAQSHYYGRLVQVSPFLSPLFQRKLSHDQCFRSDFRSDSTTSVAALEARAHDRHWAGYTIQRRESDHVSVHFGVLTEANLVAPEKQGESVILQLQMSVFEDILLSIVEILGDGIQTGKNRSDASNNSQRSKK